MLDAEPDLLFDALKGRDNHLARAQVVPFAGLQALDPHPAGLGQLERLVAIAPIEQPQVALDQRRQNRARLPVDRLYDAGLAGLGELLGRIDCSEGWLKPLVVREANTSAHMHLQLQIADRETKEQNECGTRSMISSHDATDS